MEMILDKPTWCRENVSMQFVPTTYQKADILTKGLQAYTHELAREGLRLRLCNGL